MSVVAILTVLAAVIVMIVVTHQAAPRRYATLLDRSPQPHSNAVSGRVQGRIGGRDATLSLSLPRRRPKRPGELWISIGCSAPLTLSAERESLSKAFEKAVGMRQERTTGDEELDRKFLFRFDDRASLRTCLERASLKGALLKLAGLGVGSIRVERGSITASIPLQLIPPPRFEIVREVVDELIGTASAMESALVGTSRTEGGATRVEAADRPRGFEAHEPALPGARARRADLALPLIIAVFLATVALAYAVAAPMWERGTQASWEDQLSLMQGRLVLVTLAAGLTGLVAAYLVGGNALV